MKANRDKPFFCYLAYSLPHVPLFASEEFQDKSLRGLYGDVVEEIDWSVGQVVDTLRELGIEGRTLVLFTSDNGPWLTYDQQGGSAGLLRGGKGSTWEGGMREPTIFWWPGKIQPGVVRQLGATLDLLPTCVTLAGGTPADGPRARRRRPLARAARQRHQPARHDVLLPHRADLRGPPWPVQGPLHHAVGLRRRPAGGARPAAAV